MYDFVYSLIKSKVKYTAAIEAYRLYRQDPKAFVANHPEIMQVLNDALFDIQKEIDLVNRLGLKVSLLDDLSYPPLLNESKDAPLLVYSNFVVPRDYSKYITIIGSRSFSEIGVRYTQEIIQKIAMYYPGYTIVTASVPGIANVVRQCAAYYKIPVITVLSLGHNHMHNYNSALPFTYTISAHLLTQEQSRADFIVANSVMAGMSERVIVVEAGAGSGCLDVAKKALEYGRDVYTVVSPNLPESFAGNFELINSNIAADYKKLFP